MTIFQSELMLALGDGAQLLPFCRYVLSNALAENVQQEIAPRGADYSLSNFNSYLKPVDARGGLGRKRIAIYRHGAFGDTLVLTAFLRYLRKQNPDATLDVYTRPQNLDLFHDIGVRAIPFFPTFDALQRYDGHILFENMLECDSEPDQGCAIDAHFRFAGIDPETVPDADKVPWVRRMDSDDLGFEFHDPHIVVQWSASNSNRTWPHAKDLIPALQEAFPRHVIVVAGEGKASLTGAGVADLRGKTPRFRHLIPIIQHAALVVCPDSSVGHLAAAFPEVPVISLWGLFHPNDRVKYYRNHHPLFVPEACPHTPCRSHLGSALPVTKCGDAPSNQGPENFPIRDCAALRAITVEMVVEKGRALLAPALNPLAHEQTH